MRGRWLRCGRAWVPSAAFRAAVPDGGPLDSSPTGLEWGYQRIRNHAQLALTILLAVTDEAPAVAHHLWFELRRASLGFSRVLVPCCRVNMVKGGERRMEGAIFLAIRHVPSAATFRAGESSCIPLLCGHVTM